MTHTLWFHVLFQEAGPKGSSYAKDREASLRRAREDAALADGISWGMGEDALEEAEVCPITYVVVHAYCLFSILFVNVTALSSSNGTLLLTENALFVFSCMARHVL